MKGLRVNPIHCLWLAFVLLLSFTVLGGWLAYHMHPGASGLAAGQPEMTNKSDRARARIERETDIVKLRRWALMSHDRSVKDWDLVVFTNTRFADALWCFAPGMVFITFLVGLAIHGLLRGTPKDVHD